jgi:hypothetical protein
MPGNPGKPPSCSSTKRHQILETPDPSKALTWFQGGDPSNECRTRLAVFIQPCAGFYACWGD